MTTRTRGIVVLVSPAFGGRGGISAVVESYFSYGIAQQLSIEVVNTFSNIGWKKPLVLLQAITRLLWLLVFRRARLVHINTAANNSFRRKVVFWAIARLCRCSVVWQIHSGEFPDFARSRPWVAQVLRRSAGLAVLSQKTMKDLRSIVGESIRLTVIPNPYEPHRRLDLSRHSSPLRQALFLGRLTEKKGVGDLLRAWAKLVQTNPTWHLMIAGDGELDRYKDMAHQLGLERNVTFVGWRTGKQKEELLASSQLLLLPSHFEGMPVSVLEAFGFGCVVVATATGALPEMLDGGRCGQLHAIGDVDGLVRAIESLQEPALRLQMAEAAWIRLREEYSPVIVLAALRRWYAESGA